MRKLLVACVVLVLMAGVYAFVPATAGSDKGIVIAQAAAAAPAPAEPAKAEPKKEEPKKEEAKKEEPKKEEGKPAAGDAPATITFENCGKMAPVTFDHKMHGEKNKCADCHEGTPPVFEKKISKVQMKMADIYAGKNCGHCHTGKEGKPFEAKKACAKCHKKK